MKALLKKATLALVLVSSVASAELISNVPLDVSRFELMEVGVLAQHANTGNQHAQFFLAKRLQKGEGVAVNSKNALYWYTRAAEQGVAPAQLNLGIMYFKGEGVEADKQQARLWLEKAAHQGDNRATFALAILEEQDKKMVDAYKWYELSSREIMLDEKVRHRAKDKIGQLALNLSQSDIEQATKSANAWFQNK